MGIAYGNHKAKLAYVTPKLVHPIVHAPIHILKYIVISIY